jgi:hypothetical protein
LINAVPPVELVEVTPVVEVEIRMLFWSKLASVGSAAVVSP